MSEKSKILFTHGNPSPAERAAIEIAISQREVIKPHQRSRWGLPHLRSEVRLRKKIIPKGFLR